ALVGPGERVGRAEADGRRRGCRARRDLRPAARPEQHEPRARERSRGRERRPVLGELPVYRGAAPAVRVSPWLVAALATALGRSGAAADTAPADRGVPAVAHRAADIAFFERRVAADPIGAAERARPA